jgi:hypothetical protein
MTIHTRTCLARILLLAAALAPAACRSRAEGPAPATEPAGPAPDQPAPVTAQPPAPPDQPARFGKVQEEAGHLADATRAYAYEQKQELLRRMETERDTIRAEIDELSAAVGRLQGQARDQAEARLAALRDRAARFDEHIDGVRRATAATWTEAQRRVRESLREVSDAARDARRWMSERIAP